MRPMGHGGGHRHGNGQGNGQGQSHQQHGQGRHRRNLGALNRQYDSTGPEGKVRGTAVQLYERYKAASRETQSSDPILSEAYGQFADHYYRVAAENGAFDFDSQQRREMAERSGDGVDVGGEMDFAEPALTEASPPPPPPPPPAPAPAPQPVVGLNDGVLRTVAARPAVQPSLLSNLDEPAAPMAPAAVEVSSLPMLTDTSLESEPEPGVKRPRGRPRKIVEAPLLAQPEPSTFTTEADAAADEPAAAPRRRGRPRKAPVADPTV